MIMILASTGGEYELEKDLKTYQDEAVRFGLKPEEHVFSEKHEHGGEVTGYNISLSHQLDAMMEMEEEAFEPFDYETAMRAEIGLE